MKSFKMGKKIPLLERDQCCGCGLCIQICPVNAITMRTDNEGFLSPKLNQELCVSCGLCVSRCPVNIPLKKREPLICYAAKSADLFIRRTSSSGGIFSELCKYVLSQKGILFGAAWISAEHKVKHIKVEDLEDLSLLRGSKYVQSDIGNIYPLVKNNLDKDRLVLFSGTPCQIAGLRAFLKRDYATLLYVEVICHAVPSPRILNQYLTENQAKEKSKIINLSFRNKKCGWRNFSMAISYENGYTEYKNHFSDDFMKSFLNELCNRKACHSCSFKSGKSGADITLGDYWDINNKFPDMDDDLGVSLVLIYSGKGKTFFNQITSSLDDLREVSYADAITSTRAIIESPQIHPRRQTFFKYATIYGVKKAVNKILRPPFYKRFFYKIRSFTKQVYLKLS